VTLRIAKVWKDSILFGHQSKDGSFICLDNQSSPIMPGKKWFAGCIPSLLFIRCDFSLSIQKLLENLKSIQTKIYNLRFVVKTNNDRDPVRTILKECQNIHHT
jgi:hypothetical protein